MAINGIVPQSITLSHNHGGFRRLITLYTDDPQTVVEAPGWINRYRIGVSYRDGWDIFHIISPTFSQTYMATEAADGTVSLAFTGGAGSGTVLGDGFISNVALVGTNLVFTGVAGAFSGTIPLGAVVPTQYMRSITGIDLKTTGVANQYTVSVTWTDQNGAVQTTNDSSPVTIALTETVTTLVDQGNRTYTYTSENGTATVVDARDTVTTLVDNLNGSFTYTNEAGLAVTISAGAQTITTLVDNANRTYTYTSENATTTLIDARDVTTTLVDNNNATFTYTNELGAAVTYAEEVTTLVDAGTGIYTYTNELGAAVPFGWVRAVNTVSLLPNPSTVRAGMLYVVNNDTAVNNGIYKVDGAIGANGVGFTQI